MKKRIKFFSILFGILIIFISVYLLLGRYSSTRNGQLQPEHIYSPDSSKVVIPTINTDPDNQESYLQVYFEIKDTQSEDILLQVQTDASDRMRWSIVWIGNNIVLLDSADIGSYCWREINNGLWEEADCPQ